MREEMSFDDMVEKHLRLAANQLKAYLGQQEWHDIIILLDNGENGVAWELLSFIVRDRRLKAPAALISAGVAMDFDVEALS